ncbi:hypothetical protein [Chlorobium sp.]|jgi:hypothetical protein|uniref:hypothetical protein n=1 Tax=Chlorobium sp. TaxID=1095 RepID=UPI003C391562|nr:hypothetical protein [Chlorobiaceae bacterium]NTW94567.1 hypothetical protein [Chlorobiaceae bacterium]
MSWGVEDEQRRRDILELMDISARIVKENPNYVNEVKKSTNGCWMEQMYAMMRCDFCDLSPDCPVREENEWQEYLRTNNIVIGK